MGDFRKLIVWQKAHDLTIRIYDLTKRLPKDEQFGLKSQIRRAAVSCESNIAEGETRFTDPAKINFFIDARSSSAEVQSQLMIIRDVYTSLAQEAETSLQEYEALAKQLNSLISFRRKDTTNKKSKNQIAQKPKSLIT